MVSRMEDFDDDNAPTFEDLEQFQAYAWLLEAKETLTLGEWAKKLVKHRTEEAKKIGKSVVADGDEDLPIQRSRGARSSAKGASSSSSSTSPAKRDLSKSAIMEYFKLRKASSTV